jgi:hypothetical protein
VRHNWNKKMSARKVSQHFDGVGKVPVDIKDVLKWINAHLMDEVINIHGIDISADSLNGGIVSQTMPQKPHPNSAVRPWKQHTIAYRTQLSMEMQRLVVCKEVLHVFEPPSVRTNDQLKVLALAEALMVKNGGEPGEGQAAALADNISKWNAVTVLFPFGYWEECFKAHKEGAMTLDEIADALEIPRSYVAVTMTDGWRAHREIFLGSD